jgi:hypothetical protein
MRPKVPWVGGPSSTSCYSSQVGSGCSAWAVDADVPCCMSSLLWLGVSYAAVTADRLSGRYHTTGSAAQQSTMHTVGSGQTAVQI